MFVGTFVSTMWAVPSVVERKVVCRTAATDLSTRRFLSPTDLLSWPQKCQEAVESD
jgi:hypothetical protein